MKKSLRFFAVTGVTLASAVAAHAAPSTGFIAPTPAHPAPPTLAEARVGSEVHFLETVAQCGSKYAAQVKLTNDKTTPWAGVIDLQLQGMAKSGMTFTIPAKESKVLTIASPAPLNCKAPIGKPPINVYRDNVQIESHAMHPSLIRGMGWTALPWIKAATVEAMCGTSNGSVSVELINPKPLAVNASVALVFGPNLAPPVEKHLSPGQAAIWNVPVTHPVDCETGPLPSLQYTLGPMADGNRTGDFAIKDVTFSP